MRTILFFNDWNLNRRDNLVRHVGRPKLVQEATFVDPHIDTSFGYPTVYRDRSVWRILYQGAVHHGYYYEKYGPGHFPLVAESDDGIRWKVPDLPPADELPERRFPNHLGIPVEKFGEWCHYVDERADDPAERVKAFIVYNSDPSKSSSATALWTSPDGVSWRQKNGVVWSSGAPDPGIFAFWNEAQKSYVISARPTGGDRRIALSETSDWLEFGEPYVILEPDSLDTPLSELYGMPVFPYEGVFIGLLWIFHTDPMRTVREFQGVPLGYGHINAFWGGKIDSQLTFSRDGRHFHRTLRDPLIPIAEPGDFGAGSIMPTSLIIDDDQSIRIYSSSSKREHGLNLPSWEAGSGALLMHKLRLDGFMYLESAGGSGMLGTRPITWNSGEVRLNVQAPGGEARVQVTDPGRQLIEGYSFSDCLPFSGDDLFWEPQWKDGRRMSELAGQNLRLEISLFNARIYAIRGDFGALA